MVYMIVDDDTTAFAMSVRLAPDYRSLGIWPQFHQQVIKMVLQHFPFVRHIASITINRKLMINRMKRLSEMFYIMDQVTICLT